MDKLSAPDVTAVLTALWRRAHLLFDDEPHVFEDDLGFRLANVPEVLAAAGIPAGRRGSGIRAFKPGRGAPRWWLASALSKTS